MHRRDYKIIPVTLGIIILALFMIYKLPPGFDGTIVGAIGPGVYPLIVLLALIVSALFITVKAFARTRYRLISPYPTGSIEGLLVDRVATILSKGLGTKIAINANVGEGFFLQIMFVLVQPAMDKLLPLSGATRRHHAVF